VRRTNPHPAFASSRQPIPHSPARQTQRPEPLSPHITTRAERYWALVLRANQSGTTIDGLHRTIDAERKRNAELVELNRKLAEQLAQAKQHFDQLPSEFPQADRVRLSAKYQVAVGRPAEAVAALDGFVEAADPGDLMQSAKTLTHAVEMGMRAGQLHPLD
jgi:hypothetical protein